MMALWLYRLLSRLFLPVLIPFLALKDRLRGKSRPSWSSRFRPEADLGPADLWIQAVSVGEVELSVHLVRQLLSRRPGLKILVTATTATGLALARRRLGGSCGVAPCPLDLTGPLRRFLKVVRPRGLVLIETELWPEMLHQAAMRNIPVFVVNARLSEKSRKRYGMIRPLLRPLLDPLSLVLTRDQQDLERFRSLGVPGSKLRLGGNLKYDLRADGGGLEWEEAFRRQADGRPVLVAGSTMDGEEEMLLEALRHPALVAAGVQLILAPRHPERFDAVAAKLRKEGLCISRRSEDVSRWPERPDIFLLDTIGELSRAYRLGDIAFIGGSLVPTGGHNPLEALLWGVHNPLEALLWGVPVLSGPFTENFEEIYRQMSALGAVRIVDSAEKLAEAAAEWLEDAPTARDAGKKGRDFIESQAGSTDRVAVILLEQLGAID